MNSDIPGANSICLMGPQRDGFAFKRDFLQAASELSVDSRARVMLATVEYGLNRQEPNYLSGTEMPAWRRIKPALDTAWYKADMWER